MSSARVRRALRELADSGGADADDASALFTRATTGTIRDRTRAFGASVPWYLNKCRLGEGTNAASRARKSSGSR